MHAKFNFPYGLKFEKEVLEKLESLVGKKIQVDESMAINSYYSYDASLIELYELIPGIELKVIGISPNSQMARLSEKINEVMNKIDKINDMQITYNEKCEVHVPGLGLLAINETKVVEDCCTDELDGYMQEGWRIIAACPQPNQRRPDYVLGRTNRNRA